MESSVDSRIDGPHLPTTVGYELPLRLREIKSAVAEFQIAADDFLADADRVNTERVWDTSRLAWNLLLPHRQQLVQTDRSIAVSFRTAVERVRAYIAELPAAEDENIQRLATDLARRSSLLDALLAEDGEPRIRELLTQRRPTQGTR